jgi:two-component system, response regulator PdtaR
MIKMRVLVVDDEQIVAKALARAFTSKGHSVATARTGEEGIEKWEEFKPQIVMLDVVMPGMTGPQVVEEYRRRKATDHPLPEAKVVLMTAHSGVRGREPALELGADDFIPKPFEDIFDLVTRIENLL